MTVQIGFGMDNDYKCELEVWGSKGTLRTGRVLTAPAGFVPKMTIKKNTPEAIEAINMENVKAVRYYNVAGVESLTPFQGVNIVVREMTDGTKNVTKMIK